MTETERRESERWVVEMMRRTIREVLQRHNAARGVHDTTEADRDAHPGNDNCTQEGNA